MIGRIPILDVQPAVDGGRYPAKSVAGETFPVSAVVFREGHGAVAAAAVLRDPDGNNLPLEMMHELAPGTDRWGTDVVATHPGNWSFRVEAWADPIADWHHDAGIKVPRGQDIELVMAEGAILFDQASKSIIRSTRVRLPEPAPGEPVIDKPLAPDVVRAALAAVAEVLRDPKLTPWDRLAATRDPEVTRMLAAYPLRKLVTRSRRMPLMVERERALYGAWYEFFPRSEGVQIDPMGRREPVSGTLQTAARRLDAIAEMGFDVVYLPPVHPIGTAYRKGRNNTLDPQPGDPGSPWAIGGPDGGHDSIHPDLGTFDDFDDFVARTRELGMEVALDFALQASPDHPWVKEHPEWFTTRADGTIAYAENPPKKYQDIYPINFDNDPEGIYRESLRVLRLWMDHGVRIFRVDNPHTKPLAFWERLLGEIHASDPDVLFLAEAFTRPAMMHALAMVGFNQSYTYFTWRTHADELTEYLRDLSGATAAYMRPNFFTNTPDILHEYLQHGGPPAFKIRAVLAAMLSPTWGIYSGYELCENIPVRPGSEEYMDSEKYQYRPRDWDQAARENLGIAPYIATLNRIRKSHPALHRLRNLRFHTVDQPDWIAFSKRITPHEETDPSGPAGHGGTAAADTVLVVANLDPRNAREATVWLDLPALGMDWGTEFTVTDEISGESYRWGQANYVRLDPSYNPAHVFTVRPGQ
ncbi:MAG TPA: alpha-1,4-glucan--maltose-1-phosphate maltosyltransferase [Streptosporangiaceae bacterium]|nr:alpha-1,4-glucan--maltose-1-phosphate maltosyltransferase [Streptosporangiaceae bacterium]